MTGQEGNRQDAQSAQGSKQEATRSDTLAEGGARPVNAAERAAGQPAGSEIVGAAGGTDASAAAAQSGNQGPGGAGMRRQGAAQGVPGTPGGSLGAGGDPSSGATLNPARQGGGGGASTS